MPARTFCALAIALCALAAGCGGDEGGSGGSGAAAAIPADPVFYVEADISGAGEQADNLEATLAELGEVPLLGSALDPRTLIEGAIEDLGSSNGIELSYAEDFEPWLGDTAAIGYTSLSDETPGFVFSVEASDEEVARDSIERITGADAAEETDEEYDGVSYQVSGSGDYALGVFDDKVVLATVDEFEQAVDASRGDSVATTGDVGDALDVLGDDHLATLYVDSDAALDLAVEQGEADETEAEVARAAAPELFDRPVVAGIGAGQGTVHLDVAVGHSGDAQTGGSDRLAEAPADSFAALGLSGVGEAIRSGIDRIESLQPVLDRNDPIAAVEGEEPDVASIESQFEDATGVPLDEALGSVGDAVAFGRGKLPGDFAAELDVEVTGDGKVAAELIDSLKGLAEQDSQTTVGPALRGGEGVSATPRSDVDTPVRFIAVELGDELQVIAAADRAAAEGVPSGKLGDTERFGSASDALGSDYDMVAFADLGPILDAALGESSLLDVATGGTPPDEAMAKFFADKLGFAGAGVRYDGDFAVQRLVVGLS